MAGMEELGMDGQGITAELSQEIPLLQGDSQSEDVRCMENPSEEGVGSREGGLEGGEESSPVVLLREASLAQSDNVVLEHVDLTIRQGDFYYLVGRVGSGKSTLISTLMGELPLREGAGMVCGYDLRRLRRRDVPYLRRKLGVVFQDFKLLPDRSVERNLHFALRATGWRERGRIQHRIDTVLDLVGLKHKAFKMPSQLSGGEQQRVTIARALLNDPPLLLADEPTGNLDPETSSGIVTLLHELASQGKAVVMATHNHTMVNRFPARVLQCQEGSLVQLASTFTLK